MNSTEDSVNTILDGIGQITDELYIDNDSLLEKSSILLVLLFLFVSGVIANCTIIYIFAKHKELRTGPNMYMCSLACADLINLLVCIPYTAIMYIDPKWRYDATFCQLYETTNDITMGVSVFTLTALSAERYCAVINPMRRFQIRPLSMLTAGCIWLLAIAIALPSLLFSQLEMVKISYGQGVSKFIFCFPYWDPSDQNGYARLSVILKALIYFVIPISLMSIFYALLAYALAATYRDVPGKGAIRVRKHPSRPRRPLSKMAMSYGLVFFICYLPQQIFSTWYCLTTNSKEEYNYFWHGMCLIGHFFRFCSPCLNPYILYSVNAGFRQKFRRYLFPPCCRSPARNVAVPAHRNRRQMETSFNTAPRPAIQAPMEDHSLPSTSQQPAPPATFTVEVATHSRASESNGDSP